MDLDDDDAFAALCRDLLEVPGCTGYVHVRWSAAFLTRKLQTNKCILHLSTKRPSHAVLSGHTEKTFISLQSASPKSIICAVEDSANQRMCPYPVPSLEVSLLRGDGSAACSTTTLYDLRRINEVSSQGLVSQEADAR